MEGRISDCVLILEIANTSLSLNLVNNYALGFKNCREICKRENTNSVSHCTSAYTAAKIIHVIKCKITSNFILIANCNKIFFNRLGTETCYLKFLILIVMITVGRGLIKKNYIKIIHVIKCKIFFIHLGTETCFLNFLI